MLCFWLEMEKTLESSLDSKEIKPVNLWVVKSWGTMTEQQQKKNAKLAEVGS